MFKSIGTTEIIVIAAILLFLFGSKKIPELFKGLGDAIKEFKKASKDEVDDESEEKKNKN